MLPMVPFTGGFGGGSAGLFTELLMAIATVVTRRFRDLWNRIRGSNPSRRVPQDILIVGNPQENHQTVYTKRFGHRDRIPLLVEIPPCGGLRISGISCTPVDSRTPSASAAIVAGGVGTNHAKLQLTPSTGNWACHVYACAAPAL